MKQIKDLMSRDVQVSSPDETIAEAARRMGQGDFGMLPVSENDRMVGAISDRDIAVRGVAAGMDGSAKVRDVMSSGVCWAYDDASVDEAAKIMADKQIRRLPIVNRDKRLVGILSLGDIALEKTEQKPAVQALSGISEHA